MVKSRSVKALVVVVVKVEKVLANGNPGFYN